MKTKRILIVDDEPRTREGLKRTLEKWSEGQFEITCLDNAQTAMDYLSIRSVHLLITDIRMPKMTGLKLIEILRKKKIQPIIIVISAYSEFEYAQEALRQGVINYLLKPIGKSKLIEAVEDALRRQEKWGKSKMIEKFIDEDLIDIEESELYTRSIRQAITYIDEHYANDVSLKEVADLVHLNPSYLSTLFRDELNLSFTDYLTKVRIQRAKQLLLTTDLHVTEIAESVGYNTPRYFNKVFKDNVGLTPTMFRRTNENAF